MADLKQICLDSGFYAVQTYIQSGNIVFESTEKDSHRIEKELSLGIFKKFGTTVPVFIYTPSDWKYLLSSNPFFSNPERVEIAHLHVTFLQEAIPADQVQEACSDLGESWKGHSKFLYLHCPQGYGKTKFTNTYLEKKLKTIATTRNWKTILKLGEILGLVQAGFCIFT